MSTHPNEHEELLQRVFEGEIPENDPRARELLLACDECRRELARWKELDERLTGGVARERADLAQARTEASAEDAALVRETLARALPPPRRLRRLHWLALAAGIVAVAFLAARWFGQGDEPAPEVLLGDDILCLEPVGKVAAYGPFRWESELPPRAHFELRFYEDVDGRRGAEMTDSRILDLQEPRWMPTDAQQDALPSRLFWEVFLVDETTGEEVDSGWAWAWL